MSQSSQNIVYIDLLRALAILGVVLIHISSPVVHMAYKINNWDWWIGNFFDSSVRFAVPLFLMISGATLLEKETKIRIYFKKRFARVVLPFLFWLIIYGFYRWINLPEQAKMVDFSGVWYWLANLFLKEGVSKHFWYIYMIIFLYLLIPFAGKILRKMTNRTLIFIVVFWLILLVIFRDIPFNAYNWQSDYLSKFGGYLLHSGYMITGFLLVRLKTDWERLRKLSVVVYLLSVFIAAFSVYWISKDVGFLYLNAYSYLSVNTFIQSLAVFILFLNFDTQNKIVLSIIKLFSDYSYGIYLCHILVISILFNLGIYWKVFNPLVSVPLLVLLVVGVSLTIIFLLRKIPGGKFISG